MKINENYFQINEEDKKYQNIEDVLDADEKLLYKVKPNKKANILNSCLKMLPVAIFWIIFDSIIISMFLKFNNEENELPSYFIIFIILFFAIHLIPFWIWIFNIISANKKYKNLEYAFTDQRIIIKEGIVGIDFKSIYYNTISSCNIKIGLIDKLLKVGDIYINSFEGSSILLDLKNPYRIYKEIERIIKDSRSTNN